MKKEAVPVAVDTPLHVREKTRVVAVLCKYQPVCVCVCVCVRVREREREADLSL